MKKMRRRVLLATIGILWLGMAAIVGAQSQQSSSTTVNPRWQAMSDRFDKTLGEQPFVGVTIDGSVASDVFGIRSTGVSTKPVRQAAANFLSALDEDQRARSVFDVDDVEWRKWMNQHFYLRQGVSFLEMSQVQREAAFGLLSAGLSAKGLRLSRDIMRLNHTLAELNDNDFEEYGEWLYHLTVMGEPSETEPWGWQLDGHHLIINYFVLGDQVVMTPLFVGSEPVTAEAGKYKGISILQQEQAAGLAFVNKLSGNQLGIARLSETKDRNHNRGEAGRDNVEIPFEGLHASVLSEELQSQLLELAGLFVGNLREPHAAVRMEEVAAHLDQTYFAWIGATDDDAVFYYRIHSPVILIEFDHQRPANLRHLMPPVPSRQHIHVVVRTPNGNDYGKDLLRQHLVEHAHHQR